MFTFADTPHNSLNYGTIDESNFFDFAHLKLKTKAAWILKQFENLIKSWGNVCFIKICSKLSSNTLLSLLRNFMKQTLPQIKSQTKRQPLMNLVNTTLSQKYGDP